MSRQALPLALRVLQFSLAELPGFRDLAQETKGRGESVELDPVTQYYLLHRAYFGLKPAPAGACILYANACGKNETELKVVWNILEQGGKSGPGKRGRPRKEEDQEDIGEEGSGESKGNEYRLLRWDERAMRDGLGEQPYYCDPEQFFATTYATQNLRQFCRLVLRRLARQPGGESIINVAQTFGGGESHTLTALYYLTTLGDKLPKSDTAVGMILNDAQLTDPPSARVAAVSFDKVDWKTGCEVKAPDGKKRSFRMPWNLIAWQFLGQRGVEILDRDESEPDFDTPPADTLWAKILQEVEAEGQGALILIDEFLMWAHDAASPDPTGERQDRGPVWYDRLKNFFQRLAQAVESSERSCLVVSLLATDPQKSDDIGKAILSACNHGLNRQASLQSPVEREDLAELLRRRLFEKYPENPADRKKHILAFWPRMAAVDPIRAKQPDSEQRLINAYPFHPDLLDRFFGKWTELDQFQRTRGVLQTFAMALRDAEKWDESPLIGSQVFLEAPGKDGLSEALLKLAEAAIL
ncbi:MAG: DUF499 domain-containing protein [Acidobacteria bacterium]|nr:DUF499 domain-containing protein [Acidobacteriota bacterium]